MPEESPNEILLDERNWLENLMTLRLSVTVTDTGLGMGQADIAYERNGRRWNLTIREATGE